jgi:hypothetical protein
MNAPDTQGLHDHQFSPDITALCLTSGIPSFQLQSRFGMRHISSSLLQVEYRVVETFNGDENLSSSQCLSMNASLLVQLRDLGMDRLGRGDG